MRTYKPERRIEVYGPLTRLKWGRTDCAPTVPGRGDIKPSWNPQGERCTCNAGAARTGKVSCRLGGEACPSSATYYCHFYDMIAARCVLLVERKHLQLCLVAGGWASDWGWPDAPGSTLPEIASRTRLESPTMSHPLHAVSERQELQLASTMPVLATASKQLEP